MTKAADALFISRPALVQQIKAAETKLGFTVFERTAKGVSLTQVGKMFLEEGSPIIKNYEQLYRKCLTLTKQLPKTVVIGTLPDIHSPLLISVCKKFRRTYPDVDIVFRQEAFPDYFPAFLAGNFDITTDYMFNFADDILDKPDIEVLQINPYHLDICIPNSDPLSNLKKATSENLRNRKLMMHARGVSKADDLLRGYLETHEPTIEIIDFPYISHELFVKAEIEDFLITCVKQYCFNSPHFTIIPMNWEFLVQRGILYRKAPRPEVEDFIDIIKQTIKENDL